MNDGSGWVTAIALVVAVNPLRLAGQLPTTRVAAAGAGLTALVYLSLGAAAGPLLDAIDVSDATMMVAAGLVLMVGSVRDLLVGPPAAEPALSGWGAAIVPVTLPMLARPHAGVLALAAGSGGQMAPLVFGIGLMVVVSLAATARLNSVATRVVQWLSVGAAVAAMVVGVAIAVDGVFAV